MNLAKINVMIFYLFMIVIIQINIARSCEDCSHDTEPLIKPIHNIKNRTLEKGTLKDQFSPYLQAFNLKEIRQKYTNQFKRIAYENGQQLDFGLLAIINLTSSHLKVLHYEIPPEFISIVPRGYGKKNVENVSFLTNEAKFIKLFKLPDENGTDLYYVSTETEFAYTPISYNVIVFGEYDKKDSQSIIEGILERYKLYSQKQEQHLLEGRLKREPELSSYLEDPRSFSKSLKNTNLIFFYEATMLISD